MSRPLVPTCALLLLLAACIDSAEPAEPDELDLDTELARGGDGVIAVTTEGPIRGVTTATTREFRGIPYAAAPVGALRWRPPQPPARHRGVRDATRFAPHCAQLASPFGQASSSEDCLFLNITAPRGRGHHGHARGLRPVMVWIHGGALVTGESDDYDATRLVDQGDVIAVTINYRLGALGFTAHPALTAESPVHASGNYGLLDQQEALRWIQRNIARFGGDPSRVTIFGESAGGLSVHAQLASPGSHGLFQRAIVQSGAYQLAQPTLAAGEAAGTAFAAQAGCPDQTAACLRGLGVAQILASQPAGIAGASPVIDGAFLPRAIADAFATGQFNRVPVIEGANHDEWRLFVGLTTLTTGPTPAAAYPAAIQATLNVPAAVVPLFVNEYPLASFASPDLALSALGTDGIFDCNARFAARRLSAFTPTFAYEFNDPNAPQRFLPPVAFPYAAAHASEIQYLFDLPVTVPAPGLDATQRHLADQMIAYWTTFARTGQPTAFSTPLWPRYDAAHDTLQLLEPGTARPITTFAADHRCTFWDSFR